MLSSDLEVFHVFEDLTAYFLLILTVGLIIAKYMKYEYALKYFTSGYSVFSKFPSWTERVYTILFGVAMLVIFIIGVFAGPKHVGFLISLWLLFIPFGIGLMQITDCRQVKELWVSMHSFFALFSSAELMRTEIVFNISLDDISLISENLVISLLVLVIVFVWMYSIKVSLPKEFLNKEKI